LSDMREGKCSMHTPKKTVESAPGNPCRKLYAGFPPAAVKLIGTSNYEISVIVNWHVDIKAVLAASNARILLFVAVFAKHDSALYRSLGLKFG